MFYLSEDPRAIDLSPGIHTMRTDLSTALHHGRAPLPLLHRNSPLRLRVITDFRFAYNLLASHRWVGMGIASLKRNGARARHLRQGMADGKSGCKKAVGARSRESANR